MAINSLTGIGGLYNYRQIEIPKVDTETVKAQDIQNQQNEINTALADKENRFTVSEQTEDKRSKVTDLENISLTFNKNEDFAFIGGGSDIGSLDMQKAISDMQKDKVFQDYQFFVGSSADVSRLLNNEDGKIVIK